MLEGPQRGLDVLRATAGLRAFRKAPGRSHLVHDRLGHRVIALAELGEDRLEQRNALVTRGLRVSLESAPGRGDGAVDVLGGTEADAAADLFGRGIDDVQRVRRDRIYPLAIDIELEHFSHEQSFESSRES